MREYTAARRMADLDRFQRRDPVEEAEEEEEDEEEEEEEEEEEQQVKAAKDESHQATLGVLSQINLLRDAALPGTHNWMQYSVLFGPRRMTSEEFNEVVTFRIGAHRSARLLAEGEELACNCTTSKRDRGPVLRGGLSNIPAHLYRCTGEKTGFVRSHNAIARVLHDASKAAKLAVVREPSEWVDGTQAFGHGLDGPRKRPDLLIHIGQEKALVIDVTVTAGTLVSNAGRASRYPQFPLEKREADKIRVYQKSSATMSNMSSVVPFVMTPSGRFGDKACGLLLTMANRAFGADRSAKGRWLTTWRNRLVATAVQGAALQLKKQTSTLMQRHAAARRRGAGSQSA